MFINKLLYLFTCKLKFGLQVVIQFLYLVCIDCNLRGTGKWTLIKLKLLTVISEEQ